jgi:hypothetical protein
MRTHPWVFLNVFAENVQIIRTVRSKLHPTDPARIGRIPQKFSHHHADHTQLNQRPSHVSELRLGEESNWKNSNRQASQQSDSGLTYHQKKLLPVIHHQRFPRKHPYLAHLLRSMRCQTCSFLVCDVNVECGSLFNLTTCDDLGIIACDFGFIIANHTVILD